MQAKIPGQRLAERPNTKMHTYNPEGRLWGKSQEVRDEDGDQLSDDVFCRRALGRSPKSLTVEMWLSYIRLLNKYQDTRHF